MIKEYFELRRDIENIEDEIHRISYESVSALAGNIKISDEAKRRIYQKTLKRAGVKPDTEQVKANSTVSVHRRRSYNIKKPVTVAAALVLAMTIGVGSIVGAGSVTKTFGQFFHTLSHESIDKMIFNINQSQTDNGVTVTLTQGMCDGTALYIIERIDFAPSLVTLTDEMFNDSDGNYQAPFFSVDEIAHAVNKNPAIGRGFCKLLEHDAHSMTYLCTYGDGVLSDFFRSDTKWVLTASGMENLANEDGRTHECKFRFEFNATVCEPVVYNLQPSVFSADESVKEWQTDGEPDVYVNPWYMKILPGRQLRTELAEKKQRLEIKLKDGKVITDGDGIIIGGNTFDKTDLLGKDFSIYNGVYCTFAEELDITRIEYIKLYGYELSPADVSAIKPIKMQPSVKQDIPANYPVKASDKQRTVNLTEIKMTDRGEVEVPAGSLRYSVKSIEVYNNIYAAGAVQDDIMGIAIEDGKFLYYNSSGELHSKGFHDACDIKSGKLNDGFYLVEYELELTNIDSQQTSFDDSIFRLQTYCNYSEDYDRSDSLIGVPQAYILENNRRTSGRNDAFTLKRGESRTLHIGFIVNDNHRGSLSQIGLSVGTRFEENSDFVNITKAVEALKSKQ